MLEAWKTFSRRRIGFASGQAHPIYCAWLEESMELDDYPMPKNAPEFIEARAAYARAKWMGPGRGLVDIVKERQGALLGIDGGMSSLEDECAEISGTDWRDVADRRAIEMERYERLGLPIPAVLQGVDSKEAAQVPEEK